MGDINPLSFTCRTFFLRLSLSFDIVLINKFVHAIIFVQFVTLKILQFVREDLQDGGGVRRGDHLPPHKYIKNTSTCGTTPTEHLLNTGRRP